MGSIGQRCETIGHGAQAVGQATQEAIIQSIGVLGFWGLGVLGFWGFGRNAWVIQNIQKLEDGSDIVWFEIIRMINLRDHDFLNDTSFLIFFWSFSFFLLFVFFFDFLTNRCWWTDEIYSPPWTKCLRFWCQRLSAGRIASEEKKFLTTRTLVSSVKLKRRLCFTLTSAFFKAAKKLT